MFNFDEPRYEKVVSDALALRPQIEAAVDEVCEQGYSNIFFIGCGGTWAHTLPMKYWVETTTADVDVHCEIAAEFLACPPKTFNKDSVCVFSTRTGTTPEIIEAAKFCQEQGARTIERAYSLTPRAMHGATDRKTKMERLNFLDPQGNVTKAGLLAAGVYPQQFYPKLFIDVAVHAGTQKGAAVPLRFMDRTVCEGTLGEMISDAVAAVAKNLRRTSTVQGVSRIDSLEIPEEVLREAIANAVIHREYRDRFCGQSIAVDVFDDRIEVTNPGGLYGGKTRENLFDGSSRCRNATLVKLMSLVPLPDGAGSPAEGNGSGIPMMIDAMRAHGLAEPLFCPGLDRFKVVLYRSKIEPVDHGGGLIVTALKHYGELGTRELAERTELTISQVRSRVNALIAQGELEPTAPSTSRNRKYRLSERVE